MVPFADRSGQISEYPVRYKDMSKTLENSMKYIPHHVALYFFAIALPSLLLAANDDPQTYTFASRRQVGHIDQVKIVLELSGDVLMKSVADGKTERQELGLTYRRDYEEKTLQLPTATEKTLRAIRYYNEASATGKKGATALHPTLGPDSRLVAVEIAGGKETLFSPKGPFNMDELDLVTTVGDSLPLDQLLPAKPVKFGGSWKISDDTLVLLLALEEITTNSVQIVFSEVTPEYARFELAGQVEGKLYGAGNRFNLKAKCRYNRRSGRIDWFAMRFKQNRDIGVVEGGIDATVLVQIKITRLDASEKLSNDVLVDFSLKPTDELTLVRYLLTGGKCQLTHDRSWFLIDAGRDHDEFHRLNGGQDIGVCRISQEPQVAVANLPSLEQFKEIVQKLLGERFGEILDLSQAETPVHLRILRVKVKGKDNEASVHWFYYLVSDPEGRQVTFSFRVEEKWLETFGQADEQLVHSLRFVEKKEERLFK